MQRSLPLLVLLTACIYGIQATSLVVDTPIRDNGEVVEDSARLSETSFQWAGYGAPAGSTVVIYVTDTAGDGASTAPVVVSPSSDSSCLGPGF
ncbi:hypothetical protein DICSQDRAFT_184179 [Dichomitus squalens LYAD-421 SS1]|uniref:Uncharacterized protein n=2 Tax=Dichomitus squalens TaxID=114155 RepID=A0A4Q9MUS5_9APHY|nr:uncharacterized protein DICSQDRAFT_184179 [Dichomitus squalens LYAD-421 SS1]EJF55785.1 hypothetical protein DICSQDRAFT_184179 [Dichomitus squalens LYAD-421 SS1]TBU30181.1 hypothetical protein BD311DRAFT_754885 [Dichomitus squalens]